MAKKIIHKVSALNFIQEFNKIKRDKYWEKNEQKWKTKFKEALEILQLTLKRRHSTDRIRNIQRLILGYSAFCSQRGLPSGIESFESSISSKSIKRTSDHVFGATMIGEQIIVELTKRNYDIDYMVNEWLYKNLYLWMTITLTKDQHDFIPRNIHSFKEKLKLVHYKGHVKGLKLIQ